MHSENRMLLIFILIHYKKSKRSPSLNTHPPPPPQNKSPHTFFPKSYPWHQRMPDPQTRFLNRDPAAHHMLSNHELLPTAPTEKCYAVMPSPTFLRGPPDTATNNGGVAHVATDYGSVRSSWHFENWRVEPEDLD